MKKVDIVRLGMEATGTWFGPGDSVEAYARRHTKEECLRFVAWLYHCEVEDLRFESLKKS